ncbi:MAG: AAA family ATPase, partial [Clostridia bacterium]|nr:AAA family ATPase [Clostridia bacterium]
EALLEHHWKGNIRELQNTISRAYYLCDGNEITSEYISSHMKTNIKTHITNIPTEIKSTENVSTINEYERQLIIDAIRSCHGKVIPAAQKIKMGKTTIYRKIKKYNITSDEYLNSN